MDVVRYSPPRGSPPYRRNNDGDGNQTGGGRGHRSDDQGRDEEHHQCKGRSLPTIAIMMVVNTIMKEEKVMVVEEAMEVTMMIMVTINKMEINTIIMMIEVIELATVTENMMIMRITTSR